MKDQKQTQSLNANVPLSGAHSEKKYIRSHLEWI